MTTLHPPLHVWLFTCQCVMMIRAVFHVRTALNLVCMTRLCGNSLRPNDRILRTANNIAVNNNHFTISTNSALYIWELLNNKWQILFLPFNLWTIESIHFADSVQCDTPFWIPYPNRCVWIYTKESLFYFFITSKVSMARNWLGLKNLRPCVRQKSFINRENMCRSAFVCKNITTEVKGIMKGY